MIRHFLRVSLQRIARNRRFRWWVRCVRLCLTTLIVLAFVDLSRNLFLPNSHVLTDRHSQVKAHDLVPIVRSVYIVSAQYNSADILKSSWIPALLQLVDELRSVHIRVYVSIYESGSVDGTKELLSGLESSLKDREVDHEVMLDDESHAAAIEKSVASPGGWVTTRYGKELRRVSFLADVRNRALRPLDSLTKAGTEFDKILYLNDVVFSARDAMALLYTRNGSYAAACGLDFMNPPWNHVSGPASRHPHGTYDDFATRDSNGNVLISHLYPYFNFGKSKSTLLSGEPVPVQSCWNGLVAFSAQPFQSLSDPLRFRAIPDSLAATHVEASECCLVHYDNPLTSSAGVWINPAVRDGYSVEAYRAVTQQEWPTPHERRWGNWRSRWVWWWHRDHVPGLKARWRIWKWRRRNGGIKEPGLACVQDIAMVLTPEGYRMRGSQWE